MKSNARLWSWLSRPSGWVTGLLLIVVVAELAAQYPYYTKPNQLFGLSGNDRLNQLSLWYQGLRATKLGKVANLADREDMCLPYSSVARKLDAQMSPSSRLFVSGVIGKGSAEWSGIYLALQNYIFPKEVQISMDGGGVMEGSGFVGVPAASTEEVWAQGYDFIAQVTSPSEMYILQRVQAPAVK